MIAILLTSVTYGAAAFTILPVNNGRTTPFHSTQLFYLKDEVTTPVALNKDMLATPSVKKIDHPLTTQNGVIEKISYDTIQDLIDVSRPYYNLKDETVVTNRNTGAFQGFSATVTPEMHGVTLVLGEDLSAVRKVVDMQSHRYFTTQVEDEDEDDFIDPMEEAFDNMQHPMELMLLNRACIPYVAM